MSAQKMCIVPTPDGDVLVPVGTAILLDEAVLAFADKGGFQYDRREVGSGDLIHYNGHTVTIIVVPDGNGGWITPGATPEPKWVALTREQVAALPDRTPVRVEWGGVVSEGLFCAARHLPESVYLHHVGDDKWWVGNLTYVTVYVHPDDVDADPDADLVERMAKAAYETRYSGTALTEWDSTSETLRDIHRRQARAVLAVVRGEQA